LCGARRRSGAIESGERRRPNFWLLRVGARMNVLMTAVMCAALAHPAFRPAVRAFSRCFARPVRVRRHAPDAAVPARCDASAAGSFHPQFPATRAW